MTENTKTNKTSHISTAIEVISANEIRTSAYRRLLKIWDLRFVKNSNSDFLERYSDHIVDGVLSVSFIDDLHGWGESSETKAIYRDFWKVKRIVENTGIGRFPDTNKIFKNSV